MSLQGLIAGMFMFVGIMIGISTAVTYTDLDDYNTAVGVCVENDGVQEMIINSTLLDRKDYLMEVTCNNGAVFRFSD